MVADLTEIMQATARGEVAAVAIDMPIGLLADRPRRCDIEARVVLGPRRSTVFPAPLRPTLGAVDYADACRLSRAASGKALSKQAYNLLPRIAELDLLLDGLDQTDAASVHEAHPECAFLRLNGEPLTSKHHKDGRDQRRDLLARALGSRFDELLATAKAPLTDLLDATALTVTADHIVAGTTIRLGGEIDPTGKRAEIVY